MLVGPTRGASSFGSADYNIFPTHIFHSHKQLIYDLVGVEKSLKFMQSASQIIANTDYVSAAEATRWTIARSQFNLGKLRCYSKPLEPSRMSAAASHA
jgi:hypothetical protein